MTASQPFHYDFHIHSCLSPCGDGDMTPNNIVNMALLNGLSAIDVYKRQELSGDEALLPLLEELAATKTAYERFRTAIEEVDRCLLYTSRCV